MRHEFWCLFLCCPPLPVPENHSTRISSTLSVNSGALSGSVMATVTVDVWTRPRFSVGGTLWTLCPPASFSRGVRSSPDTSIRSCRVGLSSDLLFQPRRAKSFPYASASSRAKRKLSSPPSAGLISTMRFMGHPLAVLLACIMLRPACPILIVFALAVVVCHDGSEWWVSWKSSCGQFGNSWNAPGRWHGWHEGLP